MATIQKRSTDKNGDNQRDENVDMSKPACVLFFMTRSLNLPDVISENVYTNIKTLVHPLILSSVLSKGELVTTIIFLLTATSSPILLRVTPDSVQNLFKQSHSHLVLRKTIRLEIAQKNLLTTQTSNAANTF